MATHIKQLFKNTFSLKRDLSSLQTTDPLHSFTLKRQPDHRYLHGSTIKKPSTGILVEKYKQKQKDLHTRDKTKTQHIHNDQEPQQVQEIKKLAQIQTRQLDRLIEEQIERDSQLSRKQIKSKYRQHAYTNCLDQVCIGISKNIHAQIRKIYEQESKTNKPINCKYGYLSVCGFFYTIINNYLLLVNMSESFNLDSQQLDTLPVTKKKMNQTIISISEVQLTHPTIRKQFRQQLFAVCLPWKVMFYGYKLQKAIITLEQLNIQIPLLSERAECFQCDSHKIYYLDTNATLNEIALEASNTYLSYFFRKKYVFRNRKISTIALGNFINQKNKSFISKFKYFMRTAYQAGLSIFPSTYRNINLLYDSNRKNLIALVEAMRQGKKQKIVYLYSTASGEPKMVRSVTEDELFEQFSSNTYNFFTNRYRIFDIAVAQQDYYQDCNIVILLTTGARVYLHLNSQILQFVDILYPPDWKRCDEEQQKQKHMSRMAYTLKNNLNKDNIILTKDIAQYRLKAFSIYRSTFVSLTRVNGQLVSFMAKRPYEGEGDQKEDLFKLKWSHSIQKDEQLLSDPNFGIQIKRKNQMSLLPPVLQAIFRIQLKTIAAANTFEGSPHIITTNLHSLARQVYSPAQFYIFFSDIHIQSMIVVRPIDILFTIVSKHGFYQATTAIKHYFPGYKVVDLITMLVQIYTDTDGIYTIASNIEETVSIVANMESSDVKTVSNHYNQRRGTQKYRRNTRDSWNKNTLKYITLNKMPSGSKEILQKVLKLIEYISQHDQFFASSDLYSYTSDIDNPKKDLSCDFSTNTPLNSSKSSTSPIPPLISQHVMFCAVLSYYSRLLRPLWLTFPGDYSIPQLEYMIQRIRMPVRMLDALDMSLEPLSRVLQAHIAKTLQFLKLCQYTSKRFPRMPFQCLIGKDPRFFQPIIFKCLHLDYGCSLLDTWRKLFPYYLPTPLVKLMKLYSEIEQQIDKQKIYNILKPYEPFPSYFLQFLVSERQIPQIYLLACSDHRYEKCKIRLPRGNAMDQIAECIELVKSHPRFPLDSPNQRPNFGIQDKMYIIMHALDKVTEVESLLLSFDENRTLMRRKYQLIKMKKCLQIQSLLKDQYSRSEALLDNIVLSSLERETYAEEALQEMVLGLQTTALKVIFYVLMGSTSKAEAEIVKLGYENKKNEELIAQAKYILNQTKHEFPVQAFLKMMDTIFAKRIESQKLLAQWNTPPQPSSLQCLSFPGCIFAQYGCNPRLINEYYLGTLEELYRQNIQINFQSHFLYVLLGAFLFYRDYFQEGRLKLVRLVEAQMNPRQQNVAGQGVWADIIGRIQTLKRTTK